MNILSVPEFAAVLGDCGNQLVNASESNYRCTYELTYTKIRLNMNLKFVLTGINSKLPLKPLCFAIKRRLLGFQWSSLLLYLLNIHLCFFFFHQLSLSQLSQPTNHTAQPALNWSKLGSCLAALSGDTTLTFVSFCLSWFCMHYYCVWYRFCLTAFLVQLYSGWIF